MLRISPIVLLSILSLAVEARGQGTELQPSHLLNAPLAAHPVPQTAQEASQLAPRIQAGIQADMNPLDTETADKIRGTLKEQANANEFLLDRLKAKADLDLEMSGLDARLTEVSAERARLEAQLLGYQTDPPVAQTPSGFFVEDQLASARELLASKTAALKAAQEEVTKIKRQPEVLERQRAVGREMVATLEPTIQEKANAVDRERLAVAQKEVPDAAPQDLWPAREGAFLRALELAEVNARLALAKAEVASFPKRLESIKVQEAVANLRAQVAEKELQPLRVLVRSLEQREKDKRESTRQYYEEKMARADAVLHPYYRLHLGTLDARARKEWAQSQIAEWTARFVSGLLFIDLEDVEELETDLAGEQEDGEARLAVTTGELRQYVEDGEARLARLTEAVSQLASLRAEARKSQRDASLAERGFKEQNAEAKATAIAALQNDRSGEFPQDWDARAREYEAELQAWSDAARRVRDETDLGFRKLQQMVLAQRAALGEFRSRLLWAQEESRIAWDSVTDVAVHVQALPQTVIERTRSRVTVWWVTAIDPVNRARLIATFVVAVLMGTLLWFIHRKLPRTFSWLEARAGEESGLFKVLAAGLRRSELVSMVALLYCGVCAVWGVWPWATGAVAVIALGPFMYRFLRVTLDVLVNPSDPKDRVLNVDNAIARTIHRTGRWILNISVFFVPIGHLMATQGYAATNPGFVELWWFLYTTLFCLVLLWAVRPAAVRYLLSGHGALAASVKTLLLMLYPLVVGSVLFLLVLNSFRYREAVEFFREGFLETLGLVVAAWFIYRVLVRRLLPDRDMDRVIRPEDFERPEDYNAAGKVWFLDMLARAGLRLLVGVPLLILLVGTWREMDWSFVNAPIFGAGGHLTLSGLFWCVVAVLASITILRHYRRWLLFNVLPATTMDQGLGYAILTLSSYFILGVGLVVALNLLQVQGDQIAYVLSALMVGVGFGLKDLVTNFISGVMLLVERPLKVGDQVDIEGQVGVVEKINLRSTTIMAFDGVGIVVPNADLVAGKLINRSAGHPIIRSTLSIGVAYGSDLRDVNKVLDEVVSKHGLVLKRPPPTIYFMEFGESSLDFIVHYWSRLVDNRFRISSDLRTAISARFRDLGIEIPFPQRDLHVRSAPGLATLSLGQEAPAEEAGSDGPTDGDGDADRAPVPDGRRTTKGGVGRSEERSPA